MTLVDSGSHGFQLCHQLTSVGFFSSSLIASILAKIKFSGTSYATFMSTHCPFNSAATRVPRRTSLPTIAEA